MKDGSEMIGTFSYSINNRGEDLTCNMVTVVTNPVLTFYYQIRESMCMDYK